MCDSNAPLCYFIKPCDFVSLCSDCAPKKPSAQALDDESARRLWEISAEMVGLEKKME